jgi:hypothetical protein
VEVEHRNALTRIHQAEVAWRKDGNPPRSFRLVHTGAMQSEIDHPRWNRSWAVPSEHTIDDLGDLGLLRIEPTYDKTRAFVMTPDGRAAGAALVEQTTMPVGVGGHAPPAAAVLEWLVVVDARAPQSFEDPVCLLDLAVADGLITVPGREALARRILSLADEGYLSGTISRAFGETEEQVLNEVAGLALTMRAHETATPSKAARTINVFGNVVNSQVAAGDITSYTTFLQLLDQAITEIDAVTDIADDTREEAKGLLRRLGGKAASTTGEVATGVAGTLASAVVARLIGLPLG